MTTRQPPAGDRYTAPAAPFNGEDRLLLARLDERTRAIHQQLETFVTRDSFRPVMLIAYGTMASAALALLGAVLERVLG